MSPCPSGTATSWTCGLGFWSPWWAWLGFQLTLEAPAASTSQELAGQRGAVGIIHGERTRHPECRGHRMVEQGRPWSGLCVGRRRQPWRGRGSPGSAPGSTWLLPACPPVPRREHEVPEGPGRQPTLLRPGQDDRAWAGVVLSGRRGLGTWRPGFQPRCIRTGGTPRARQSQRLPRPLRPLPLTQRPQGSCPPLSGSGEPCQGHSSCQGLQGLERSKAPRPSLLPQPGPAFSLRRGVLPHPWPRGAAGPPWYWGHLGTAPTVFPRAREELRARPLCPVSWVVGLRGRRRRVGLPIPEQLRPVILPRSSSHWSQPAPAPRRGCTGMAATRFWKEGVGRCLERPVQSQVLGSLVDRFHWI